MVMMLLRLSLSLPPLHFTISTTTIHLLLHLVVHLLLFLTIDVNTTKMCVHFKCYVLRRAIVLNNDGVALAATRSPVIALFWCLIKFIITTITTTK